MKPVSDRPLHVGGPNIGSRERFVELLNGALDAGRLTNDGPLVRELESRISAHIGVPEVVLTCNGTAALEIAARALGLTGEVIVPALSFIATAHALSWQGMKPVFCDVDPETYCIDPDAVRRSITPATTGILGVHLFGRPCAVDALERIADDAGLALFYDAAHAFGCSSRGRMMGSFGRCEVFSFHATKFYNTFEGGAVVTGDADLAQRLRSMRNFGFVAPETVEHLGVNAKMTEVCAAMGIANLEALEDFIAWNRRNYETYRAGLEGVRGLRLIEFDERESNNYQYVIIALDDTAPLTRDALMRRLHEGGILAKRYFWPGCHRAKPYASDGIPALPVTDDVCASLLALPTGTQVAPIDVSRVCKAIRDALGGD